MGLLAPLPQAVVANSAHVGRTPESIQDTVSVFSERELAFAVCHRPSVCLSSVTFVRPTRAIKIFRNVSSPFGTLATR